MVRVRVRLRVRGRVLRVGVARDGVRRIFPALCGLRVRVRVRAKVRVSSG